MNQTELHSVDELRFSFGKNWASFLKNLNDVRIQQAVDSLKDMLEVDSLEGKTVLDIGSGSGLFSLSARKLGARVQSFDYDPHSVACTQELKRRYFPDDPDWSVERGDVLDPDYLKKYDPVDIVYSWGVLHHTGNMHLALEHAGQRVKPGGQLFIAIYNRQYYMSKVWLAVKKAYNSLPNGLKWLVLYPAFIRLWGPTMVKDVLRLRPFHTWFTYEKNRGMHPWYDVVDWVGGYPFEVAKPEEIFDFYRQRGFTLQRLITNWDGVACNEFVFRKET